MEDYKNILRSLLNRTEWFRLLCSNAENEVSHTLQFAGLNIKFTRDHNAEISISYDPITQFEYPEEELLANKQMQLLEEIVSEERSC